MTAWIMGGGGGGGVSKYMYILVVTQYVSMYACMDGLDVCIYTYIDIH